MDSLDVHSNFYKPTINTLQHSYCIVTDFSIKDEENFGLNSMTDELLTRVQLVDYELFYNHIPSNQSVWVD